MGFRLSDKPRDFGLNCDSTGLALAGVPLLRRDEDGFAPRAPSEIHWLTTSAYGRPPAAGPMENGLAAVARALNAGETSRAMIAAILLKLPDLDWNGAVRIAQTNDALSKYDPDELRDPDGRGTDAVSLPPGQRIDELGDLLEWIANAQPEDAPIIRGEIKRYYYDVGDVRGGNALNEALSNIVYGEPTRQERQDVLDTFEMYTRADPADIAQIGRDLLVMGLAPPIGAAIEAAETIAPSVWEKGWAARGFHIEQALGGNLPPGFPIIDRLADGIVTSIKSIDLRAATYQNEARLTSRLNRYVDRVSGFSGDEFSSMRIDEEQIRGRALHLAIPDGSLTSMQRGAIETAKKYAKDLGVNFIVTPF
jgi:hypothetical protein